MMEERRKLSNGRMKEERLEGKKKD